MTLTPCVPCNCIGGNIDNNKFKQDVEIILCAILAALPGPGGAAPVQLPDVTKAFSFFTNAYQALGFVDSAKEVSYVTITNDSDGVYAVSFNNSTEQYRILANSYKIITFDGANLDATNDMYMKYVTAPTIGNVIVEGYYYA